MMEALILGGALAASGGPAPGAADPPARKTAFRSIQEALAQPAGKLFRMRRQGGRYEFQGPGLRKITDVDNSNWWWPVRRTNSGTVLRSAEGSNGKCGWSSGVFAALYTSVFLGVCYDAPTKILYFRPFNPTGDFPGSVCRRAPGETLTVSAASAAR